MQEKKKGFKARYVVLAVLLIVVIGAAAVIGTHWDLIQAAKRGLTQDPDTIRAAQEEADRNLEDILGVQGQITDEMIQQASREIDALIDGAAAEAAAPGQQATAGEDSSAGETASPSDQTAPAGTTPASSQSASSPAQSSTVAVYTTKLYGVRDAFQGRLNGLIAAAKSEYGALPEAQRTKSAKTAILQSKLEQAEALEAECDSIVNSILSQMEAELSAAGESTAPVAEIRSYYETTKANQKALYLSMARGG